MERKKERWGGGKALGRKERRRKENVRKEEVMERKKEK